KELIQVCYDFEDLKTREREIRSLLKASEEVDCSNLTVITWDYEGREEHESREVEYVPVWKWLLNAY
ncbi:MAG: ATP-binding protein, partial [Archaeoglobaceae archaeon]